MINYLRNIRHNNRAKNFFIWNYLGLKYRLIITWIPFNFSIKQSIIPKFTFHLHARFAFSNFREWGNKHNNFFNTYISKANKIKCFFDVGSHIQKLGYTEKDLFKISKNFNYKIYDHNLNEPKKQRSLEYLILPEKVNPRKFLNVN